MRLLKNKFFIIALAAALILSTSATVLSVMGIESPLRSIFGTISIPFRWCASKIAGGISGFSEYFTEFDRLSKENAALAAENAELRAKLAESEAEKAENAALREYLGLENLIADWKLVDALVIGREAVSYMTAYTLNRGSLHGVRAGMAVMSGGAVVGYVKETGLAWCRVVPIIESSAAVGAYIERNGASGLVTGDFSLRSEGLCRLTYVEGGEEIEEGDIVLTSGTGSIYPAGLIVGCVEAVEPDAIDRSYIITIRPSVDFEKLSRVMIITSYKMTAAPPPGDTQETNAVSSPDAPRAPEGAP